MKIKKAVFPFSGTYPLLGEKWWHRFFIVAYVITSLATLGVSVALSIEGVEEKPYNINIKNNLRDFSRDSDKSVSNTVPLFLKQSGSIGCLDGDRINYVSTYALEKGSFCSAEISSHIDEAANKIVGDGSLTFEKRKELLSEALNKDTQKRYCFVHKESIDCLSENVISYDKNVVYYLQVIAYSLISVYVVSLLLQILYYKGFIYIVYGKNK